MDGPLAWQEEGPLSLPVTARELDRRTEIVVRYASYIEPVVRLLTLKNMNLPQACDIKKDCEITYKGIEGSDYEVTDSFVHVQTRTSSKD